MARYVVLTDTGRATRARLVKALNAIDGVAWARIAGGWLLMDEIDDAEAVWRDRFADAGADNVFVMQVGDEFLPWAGIVSDGVNTWLRERWNADAP